MKISLLTFQTSKNYGAVLQAFATAYYLKNIKHLDVTILNYCPKYSKPKVTLRNKINTFIMRIFRLPQRKATKERFYRVEQFVSEHMPISEKVYNSIADFKNLDCDMIISGSDQLWNPLLTGGFLDRVFFCDFDDAVTKQRYSYASSIGQKSIRVQDEEQIRKYLENFIEISVREYHSIYELKKYYDGDITHVLDPTLLLEESVYNDLSVEPQNDKPYLLVYQNSRNEETLKIAKKIADEKNLEIVEIGYYKNFPPRFHRQVINAGPKEFLGWYKKANFVITNTFHGTVFSILFNKDFYSIPLKGRETRVLSLLKVIGLENRVLYSIDQLNEITPIDYSISLQLLEDERRKSYDYLDKIIRRSKL
jgi:hypothetical protein